MHADQASLGYESDGQKLPNAHILSYTTAITWELGTGSQRWSSSSLDRIGQAYPIEIIQFVK
ncbi:MAG: hypothetical protein AAF385_09590 [Pseudomonadota bacterium]